MLFQHIICSTSLRASGVVGVPVCSWLENRKYVEQCEVEQMNCLFDMKKKELLDEALKMRQALVEIYRLSDPLYFLSKHHVNDSDYLHSVMVSVMTDVAARALYSDVELSSDVDFSMLDF